MQCVRNASEFLNSMLWQLHDDYVIAICIHQQ